MLSAKGTSNKRASMHPSNELPYRLTCRNSDSVTGETGQPASKRVEKLKQLLAIALVKPQESVPCSSPLAMVQQDRFFYGLSPSIMKKEGLVAQAPEGRGPHFPAGRDPLLNAIPERSHVVQQKV